MIHEGIIHYEEPVFRPPSEAYSLIIQATIGCSYNRCEFCALYAGKSFRIRPTEDILAELEWARKRYRRVEKIFLCDGDALCLSTDRLCVILDRCKELFPECRSVNVYGNARDVFAKGENELRILAEKGVRIIYIGAESGSDRVLKYVNKGSSRDDMAKAVKMIESSGISASVTFISGLGGREMLEEHAVESGKLVSETAPSYFSLLTLTLTPEMPLYLKARSGEFHPLDTSEVIRETELFFENISLPKTAHSIFRSNHVSNALPLRGTLPEDKENILFKLKQYNKLY